MPVYLTFIAIEPIYLYREIILEKNKKKKGDVDPLNCFLGSIVFSSLFSRVR